MNVEPVKRRFSRRKFLAAAGLGGLGVAAYSGLVEPFRLEVGRHEFRSRAAAAGPPLKLLHLSDLHASWAVSLDFINEAIQLGLQLKPDLICVTGDFITRKYAAWDEYARILTQLSAAAPTFACLGNHDGARWAARHGGYPTADLVCQLLQQSRIELLHNRWTTVRVKDRLVRLVGLPDFWAEPLNLAAAFPHPEPADAAVRVVLSHNPDSKDFLLPFPWDLLLCGHTHGGQAVFPFIGAPFTPVRDKRFIAGMYAWENRSIHVTRGVGNVHGLRFNCPPEVSLITIV